MKILVLGGSGFVGSSIVEFKQDEHILDFTFNKNNIKNKEKTSVKMSFPDDFPMLLNYIQNKQIDLVVNAISYSGVDQCEKNKKEAYEINVKLIEKIYSICSKLHIKIVQISTDYVFDGIKGNYNESDTPNPINFYGETKLIAEKILLQNPDNAVIRTSHLYGHSKKDRFLNLVMTTLNNNQKFFGYDDIFSSATLIDDLTNSIFCIMEKELTGIFHVAGPTCLSRYEFAKKISHKFNLNEELIQPISVKSANLLAERPVNLCLDCSDSKKKLGFSFTDIDEALDQISGLIDTHI